MASENDTVCVFEQECQLTLLLERLECQSVIIPFKRSLPSELMSFRFSDDLAVLSLNRDSSSAAKGATASFANQEPHETRTGEKGYIKSKCRSSDTVEQHWSM